MTGRGLLAAMALTGALASCDQAVDLVGKAADKGESDVPEAARADSDLTPETIETLRLRAQGQNFN
ncbi:MAG: hypothetical protein ACFCUS_05795 [Rubrimonas sp.]|uniref:hypothetical protein n=1 Tax=Rubrimonas sp. TaxID=2036015 RepID=UPI002FDEC0E6